MEDYQKSLNILAHLLNRKPIEIPKYNITERDDYSLDDDLIKRFKQKFELDYKIYDYAQKLLQKEHLKACNN